MNNTSFRFTIIPILTITLCFILWILPLDLDVFDNIALCIIVLIGCYLEFKKESLKWLGFQKKKANLKNLLILAPIVSIGLFLLYYFILIPLVSNLTGQPIDFSDFEELEGNLSATMFLLLFIWTSAALGEEIIWRGYFMRQFIKFFGEGSISMIINIGIFAILFGWMHSYQGVTGQIVTGIIGLILSIIFYKRGYDLWFNIAVHGFFDTIGLALVYNGMV